MAEHDDNRKKKFTFVAWEGSPSGLRPPDDPSQGWQNRQVNPYQG